MPLYEYQCLPERHTFEVRHGMNENPVTACSVCGGPVRRVIQPVGIVFKGSGFYVNDSRKSSSTSQAAPAGKATDAASEGSTKSTAEKTETKSDSKPAPSTDSQSKPTAAN